MRASSIKNLWWISFVAGSLPLFAADWIPQYKVRPSVRLGVHVNPPEDLATHRYRLELEQKVSKGEFSLFAAVRGTAEAAFAGNARYAGSLALSEQTSELLLREFYLQYKNSGFQIRAGSQIVVWGEAYGFFFADIVNPKDMRELAIVELSQARLAVPMITARAFSGAATVEALVIPQPYFNLSASRGSDFAFPFNAAFQADVTVNEPRSETFSPKNFEVGARVSFPLGTVDVSAFFMNYLDRSPSYSMTVTNVAPLAIRLDAVHPRLSTLGLTASTDLGQIVVKSEALVHLGKRFDRVETGTLVADQSDQFVGVLGAEKTGEKLRVGLQASLKQRLKSLTGAFTENSEWLFTFHGMVMPVAEHELSWALSYAAQDGSTLTQLGYMVPLSPSLSASANLDWLEGGRSSQFGRFRGASRAYVQLTAFLGG